MAAEGPFPGSNNTSEEASFMTSNDETRIMNDSPRGSISSDSGAQPHQRPFTDSSGAGGGMEVNNDNLAGGEELDPESNEEQTGQSAAEYFIATVACLSVLAFLTKRKSGKRMITPVKETNPDRALGQAVLPSLPKVSRAIVTGIIRGIVPHHWRTRTIKVQYDATKQQILCRAMNGIDAVKVVGKKICHAVYESICKQFILKERDVLLHPGIEAWKNLPRCQYVMPLDGILQQSSTSMGYLVTQTMSGGNLKCARGSETVRNILHYGDKKDRKVCIRQVLKICKYIMRGIVHLNRNGFQHFDIKETNVLTKRPTGCHCPSILLCSCGHWQVKITDFDTLDRITTPFGTAGGTTYHRPPEAYFRQNQSSKRPTYDTYSFGVTLLHMCLGYPPQYSNKNPPPNQHQQSVYAEMLLYELMNDKVCFHDEDMNFLIQLIQCCICIDYQHRPTCADILCHDIFSG